MTALFPELAAELKTLPNLVLDGELVVLDKEGYPVFELLRRRVATKIPRVIAHAAKTMPAAFFTFHLLSLDRNDLRNLPLIERKRQLRELLRRRPTQPALAGNLKRICYLQHVETDGILSRTEGWYAGRPVVAGAAPSKPNAKTPVCQTQPRARFMGVRSFVSCRRVHPTSNTRGPHLGTE